MAGKSPSQPLFCVCRNPSDCRSREMLLGEDAGLGDHQAVAVLVPHGTDEGSDHPLVVHAGALEADVIGLVDVHRPEVGDILRDEVCELVSRPHGAEYLGKRAQDEDSLSNRTSELGRGGIFAVYVARVVVIRQLCIDLSVFLEEDGVVVIGVVLLGPKMKNFG